MSAERALKKIWKNLARGKSSANKVVKSLDKVVKRKIDEPFEVPKKEKLRRMVDDAIIFTIKLAEVEAQPHRVQ